MAFGLLVPRSGWATPVVLYGPGVDGAQATALAKDLLRVTDFKVEGPLYEFLGANGDAAVVVGAPATDCADPGVRRRSLKGELLRVRQAMLDMSYDAAMRDIDEIATRLPCLASDAGRDELYELFFSRGVAGFFERDEAGARAAFRQAAAIEPGREWPSHYPPTPQPLFLEALRELLAQPPAPLVSEVDGVPMLDGLPDDGSPRLLAGHHLLYVASSHSGLWVNVPPLDQLPAQGLLLTTAVQLANGLMRGEERYAPWLQSRMTERGWDDVVVVSEGWAVRFTDGTFQVLRADAKDLRAARRRSTVRRGPSPAAVTGFVAFAAGAGVGLGGLALHVSSFRQGLPKEGATMPPRAEYEALVDRNRAGVGMVAAGSATGVVGLVLAVVGIVLPPPIVAVTPWVTGDHQGVAFGLSGRLP